MAALLGQAVLPVEIQAVLLEPAGGNPLYAEQVCHMLADRGVLERHGRAVRLAPGAEVVFPESIQALITARLDTLSPAWKLLLQDAAVVGKVFWAGALALMGDYDATIVQDSLRELARREFIRRVRDASVEGETEYAFWHVLTRDVAYAQLPRAARVAKHRAAAAWIERTAGARVADHAEVLAHHYTSALALARAAGAVDEAVNLEGLAVRFLVLAGDRAMGLDVARADAFYRRALEHYPLSNRGRAKSPATAADPAVGAPAEGLDPIGQPRGRRERVPVPSAVAGLDWVDLVLRAAEAANQSGQLRRAVGLAREAVDTIDANVEPSRAARAHDRLGQYLLDTLGTKTTVKEVLDTCGRAVELVPGDPPTPLRARVTTRLAEALLVAGRFGEASRWCEEALAVARAVGTGGEQTRALVALAMLEHHDGDTETTRVLLHDARSQAAATGNRLLELQALQFLGNVELDVGNLAAACTALDAGTELAEQSGLIWSAPGVEGRILGCVAHYIGGDWDGVERLAAVDDHSVAARGLSAVALYVEVGRGRWAAVAERLQWLATLGEADVAATYMAGGCGADLACWQGDLDQARALVRSALVGVDEAGEWRVLSAVWPAALGVAAEADRADRARTAAHQPGLAEARALGYELLERARAALRRGRSIGRQVGPEALAWLARAEAEWTRLEGHSDPQRWQATIEAFSYGYVYEVARCQWRLAEALLGTGDRQHATVAAQAAYQTAVGLEAEPLRKALEALARQGRLDLGGKAPTGPRVAGLTPASFRRLAY